VSAHVLHRRCLECGFKYELLVHRRFNIHTGEYDAPTISALSHPHEDHTTCPRCSSEDFEAIVRAPNLIGSKEESLPYLARCPEVGERGLTQAHFPYFDAGLGVVLESPEHRQWLMKNHPDGTPREEPLVCVGNDLPWDPSGIVDREIAHTADVNRRYNAYRDEMLSHPETRRAWDFVERAVLAKDLSAWGGDWPEPPSYPAEGETIKQDLDGYLYTDSGWSSATPQRWVPLALEAAGHPPLLPDHGPPSSGPLLLEA